MKENESQATEQNEQSTTSQQGKESPASKNGVFLKRGKGQSFDEFKKVCIQRLIDAGLIKTGKDTPSESPLVKRKVI